MSPRSRTALSILTVTVALSGPPSGPAAAQEYPSAAELARREAVFRRYLEFPNLVAGAGIEPHWLADGSSFWYAEGIEEGDVRILRVDPETDEVSPMFDVARLRAGLAEALGHEPPGRGVPFESFELEEGRVGFEVSGQRFSLDLDSYAITAIREDTDAKGREDWATRRLVRWSTWVGVPAFREIASPDGRWLLTEKDHDLWLRSTYDGIEHRLTADGEERFAWDFSLSRWSPDSRSLVAAKLDRRGLVYSPVVHWLGPKETVEWWYYPDPGDPLPRTEFYILDIRGGPPVRIDLGDETDTYSQALFWRPDGSEVLLARGDRRRKNLELLGADPETGAVRTILTEGADTFFDVKGIHPISGDRFLWISERDGWAHIYVYDRDGNLQSRLTEGAWPVEQVLRVDEAGGWVYFTAPAPASEIDPELGAARLYDTHLYRVPLVGGPRERLTEGIGDHALRFTPSGRYFLDTYSTVRRPSRTELRSADGRLVRTLAELDPTRLDALDWGLPEEFVVKAADGETDLYGVLYEPADLDPSRKYPVIEHIYGGPQASWVPRTFDQMPYGVAPQALAQMGFVVFIVDARGTPGRGKAYQDVVYGQLGRNEIPDHVATLQQLAADRPYMDTDRVGVFGSSWGGYFTLRAMLLRPDVYDAGVAGAAVADATQYLGHERYMGQLEDNPEGYDYASNRKIADRLEGNLLFVIGTSDQNAKFAHTMTMVEALVRAGKYFDLIVLPERHHHYGYAPGARSWHERTYFIEAIRRHFVKYLLAPRLLPVTTEAATASAEDGGS